MKLKHRFIIAILCLTGMVNAQNSLQSSLQQLNQMGQNPIQSGEVVPSDNPFNSGVAQYFKHWNEAQIAAVKEKIAHRSPSKSIDTLIIGETANDSVVITGTWVHNGPIFIIGDGKLVFNNANATILGDIWVWGNTAAFISNNSTLYIPQQYFYQRSLVAAGNARFQITNTYMDFSGLSHNFVVTDSAQFILKNVTKNGFATNGLSKKGEIHIDSTNVAGEFVCTDQVKVSFRKAHTVLLWHHVPNGGILTHTFPAPDTVLSYQFSDALPGVQNIGYQIQVDTCTDVMWALMPASGSNTTVANSTLRAIGVWFEAPGTMSVSGLVNNTTYSDFTPTMTDKILHLTNCFVRTWNIYTFRQSEIQLTGSIVGEIGSMGKSKVTGQNIMVDGSGGYTWANDTSALICFNASVVNDFRATGNGMAILAYSSLLNGVAMATGQAVLIVNQCSLPELPIAYDNSCVWFNNIEHPASGYQHSMIPIVGSSYIEKSATSPLMGFSWYQLFYKKSIDTTWIPITERIFSAAKDTVMAEWNTTAIAPDSYQLKLVLCDNTIDSNKVEAIKAINILPSVVGISTTPSDNNSLFFDSDSQTLVVSENLIGNSLSIYSIDGRLLQISEISKTDLSLPHFSDGIYIALIKTMQDSHRLKFVVSH
jgi:hypothetical protein